MVTHYGALSSWLELAGSSLCQQIASQDVAFGSLFFKVVMQMLTWLESSALEAGLLSNLLKSLVAQYSHKHHITDGEQTDLALVSLNKTCSCVLR